MKEINWTALGIMFLILAGLFIYTQRIQPSLPCKNNIDCEFTPSREGCILVEGYCGKELCRVPACLNDKNIDWVRHVSSIS